MTSKANLYYSDIRIKNCTNYLFQFYYLFGQLFHLFIYLEIFTAILNSTLNILYLASLSNCYFPMTIGSFSSLYFEQTTLNHQNYVMILYCYESNICIHSPFIVTKSSLVTLNCIQEHYCCLRILIR